MSKHLLFLCLSALLLLNGCGLKKLLTPSPQKQLLAVLKEHPNLFRNDTITVHDTVTVKKVEVQTRYVAVPNRPRERRDSLQLDSLITKLSASLDSAQRKAAQASIHRLVRQRPIFPDTLCFDKLGVHGRIWQRGSTYFIRLTRDEIKTPFTAKRSFQRLVPCDCKAVTWYDPSTWPWLWVLAGFVGGCVVATAFFHFAVRRA